MTDIEKQIWAAVFAACYAQVPDPYYARNRATEAVWAFRQSGGVPSSL